MARHEGEELLVSCPHVSYHYSLKMGKGGGEEEPLSAELVVVPEAMPFLQQKGSERVSTFS